MPAASAISGGRMNAKGDVPPPELLFRSAVGVAALAERTDTGRLLAAAALALRCLSPRRAALPDVAGLPRSARWAVASRPCAGRTLARRTGRIGNGFSRSAAIPREVAHPGARPLGRDARQPPSA